MDAQEKDTQEVEVLETELQNEETQEEKKTSASRRVLMVIGIVLSIIFGFTLACNLTIIIKGALYPDDPPSVLGATPLVVLTGSMSGSAPGHIESGDLVFVDKIEAEELKVGDVIAYKSGKSIVLHRIVEVQTTEYGTLKFYTKGDANNTADLDPVYSDKIVGILTYRIPGIGHFIMFTQTPLGILLFLVLPILCFIAYDAIRRKYYADQEKKKTEELEAELERLRALAGETAGESAVAEEVTETV